MGTGYCFMLSKNSMNSLIWIWHSKKLSQFSLRNPNSHRLTMCGLSSQSPWPSLREMHLFLGFHSLHSSRFDLDPLRWNLIQSPIFYNGSLLIFIKNNTWMTFIGSSCTLRNVTDWINLWVLFGNSLRRSLFIIWEQDHELTTFVQNMGTHTFPWPDENCSRKFLINGPERVRSAMKHI